MIAHIDADSFFASVLVRKYPRLKGKPLLSTGMGGGCVIAASYEAKAHGVHTGMRLTDARKLVPDVICMPSDFREALLASSEIEEILLQHAAIVEQMSVDEWYIDVHSLCNGIPTDIAQWALQMRQCIFQQTSLSVSVGIGPSKLLAKMSSEYRKPCGITVIAPLCHQLPASNPQLPYIFLQSFLADRPAAAIPGIGRRRTVHAEAHQWKTAWDVATADSETIIKLFGRPGREMQRELLGECLSPVAEDTEPPKSISRARSFRASADRAFLWAQVLQHLQYIVLKMRRHHLRCKVVAVWLRDSQYVSDGKAQKIPQPADTEETITPYVRTCFDRLYQTGQRYTQIGLAFHDLVSAAPKQQSLFEDTMKGIEDDSVQQALDSIRSIHGRSAIQRGAAVVAAAIDDTHVPPVPLYE